MNYNDLIVYLDIEDGSQLRYFEELADLIESDEHIDYDALYQLFQEIDAETAASLFDDYFNDITDCLSDEHADMFALLDQIRMELTGIMRSLSQDDPDCVRLMTDRFYYFRNWYVYDTDVSVLARSSDDGLSREYEESVRDALTTARAGKLSGEEYAFDFSPAMEYDIDHYSMSFADLIESQEEE